MKNPMNFITALILAGILSGIVYLIIALIMRGFDANMDSFYKVTIPIAFYFWGLFTNKIYEEV